MQKTRLPALLIAAVALLFLIPALAQPEEELKVDPADVAHARSAGCQLLCERAGADCQAQGLGSCWRQVDHCRDQCESRPAVVAQPPREIRLQMCRQRCDESAQLCTRRQDSADQSCRQGHDQCYTRCAR